MLSLEAAPPSPLSVKEAEFRARWVGQQADRQELPHYFQPGGGLDDSAKAAPSEEEPKQNWMNNVDHVARDLSNRLKFVSSKKGKCKTVRTSINSTNSIWLYF